MIHTDVERPQAANPGSGRAFGFVLAVVFLLLALWPLLERGSPHRSPRVWAIAVAAAFALCAWLAPRLLAPLNRLWLRFGDLLHKIISPVALAVVFFGVITPIAFLMRLFRRDTLLLHRRSARPSYWVRREPPGPPPDSFGNQF
jgi:hypothetical protein